MGRHIKSFSNGSLLEYGEGRFDSWCVYLVRRDGSRKAPTDAKHFTLLKKLTDHYSAGKVYGDYVQIYDLTGKTVDAGVLEKISAIADSYKSSALTADMVFTILYAAMIAEENKENTRLGKRIKRLGIHMLLKEGRSVDDAAGCMRHMRWTEIAALCEARGF